MTAGLGPMVVGVTNKEYKDRIYPGDAIFSIGKLKLGNSTTKTDLKTILSTFNRPL